MDHSQNLRWRNNCSLYFIGKTMVTSRFLKPSKTKPWTEVRRSWRPFAEDLVFCALSESRLWELLDLASTKITMAWPSVNCKVHRRRKQACNTPDKVSFQRRICTPRGATPRYQRINTYIMPTRKTLDVIMREKNPMSRNQRGIMSFIHKLGKRASPIKSEFYAWTHLLQSRWASRGHGRPRTRSFLFS